MIKTLYTKDRFYGGCPIKSPWRNKCATPAQRSHSNGLGYYIEHYWCFENWHTWFQKVGKIVRWRLPIWTHSGIEIEKIVLKTYSLIYHSSEIRDLCLMKWPSEMLQNLQYFWNTKTYVVFFILCYFIIPRM